MHKRKLILALAAVLVVLTGTAAAVANYYGVLNLFFTGDTSRLEPYVQTAADSAENEDYRLTLDSSLYDGQNIYAVITITGLNDRAVTDLKSNKTIAESHLELWGQGMVDSLLESGAAGPETFHWKLPDILQPEDPEAPAEGEFFTSRMGVHELSAPSDASRSWQIDLCVNRYAGAVSQPVQLWVDFMGEDYAVSVPLDQMMEPIRITPNQEINILLRSGSVPAVLKEFVLTSTSYYADWESEWLIEGQYVGDDNDYGYRELFYLRMKDGTVLTRAQLGESNGQFETVVDLDQVAAIIFGDTEFPVDGTEPFPAELDEHLRPFEIELYRYPVEDSARNYVGSVQELCKNLGASYQWDPEDKTAEAVYRGVTIVLTAGSPTALVDGQPVEMTTTVIREDGSRETVPLPAEERNGTMSAIISVFTNAWKLDVDPINVRDERGNRSVGDSFIIFP